MLAKTTKSSRNAVRPDIPDELTARSSDTNQSKSRRSFSELGRELHARNVDDAYALEDGSNADLPVILVHCSTSLSLESEDPQRYGTVLNFRGSMDPLAQSLRNDEPGESGQAARDDRLPSRRGRIRGPPRFDRELGAAGAQMLEMESCSSVESSRLSASGWMFPDDVGVELVGELVS